MGILNTMIFNAFVFCQIFNEFNARRIDQVNVFEDITKHWTFLAIILVTCAMQVVMVEVLRSFVATDHLTWDQWLICIGIGALSLPFGVIMHLIPVEDAAKKVDPTIAKKAKIRQALGHEKPFDPQQRPLEPSDELLSNLLDLIHQIHDAKPRPSGATIQQLLRETLQRDGIFSTATEPSSDLVSRLYRIMEDDEEIEAEEQLQVDVVQDDGLEHSELQLKQLYAQGVEFDGMAKRRFRRAALCVIAANRFGMLIRHADLIDDSKIQQLVIDC